jgi:hypothetical protein
MEGSFGHVTALPQPHLRVRFSTVKARQVNTVLRERHFGSFLVTGPVTVEIVWLAIEL